MVYVVHERQTEPLAQRQQVGRGEQAIVVFERKAVSRARRQSLDPALEPRERRLGAAREPPTMQYQHVRAHELRDGRLELELTNRALHHRLALRIEHHELVGVKAEPHIELARERSGLEERFADTATTVDAVEGIAAHRVSAERQDLAVDAEGTDAQAVAVPHGGEQCLGVVPCDVSQIGPPGGGRERRDVAVRRGAELDRRVEELTAETPADHSSFTIQSPST